MKKVVWSGFCLLAGILLFWMLSADAFVIIDHGIADAVAGLVLKILAVALSAYALVTGFKEAKRE